MAQLTITINGFTYVVGCEDGQETHLVAMAAQVQKRVDSIKSLGGSHGEARLLVLASLLMADELHDLVIEMNSLRAARPAPAAPDPTTGRRLLALAERAEEIAADLEKP